MIQTTNIRRILDRVMRHPMMRDIPFETAVEYTVDFISLIGTPAIYEEKTKLIPVFDWRGLLPRDFVEMIQVRSTGLRTNGKHLHKSCCECDLRVDCSAFNNEIDCPVVNDGCTLNRLISFPKDMVYRYSSDSFHLSPDKSGYHSPYNLTYKLQGGCIFTSTKDVMVEIAYRAFAVDDEGLPLLPDNTSFLRGLENYIKLQWFIVLFDTGKIPQNVLENANKEYCWAVGDAQSEFSRLSLDKAETLFNSFKTLLPRNNEHWKHFFNLGDKEYWHTH